LAGQSDPLGATSRGTGELVRAALAHGCQQILLGVGGSACTDGGAGLLQALGARLLDRDGLELGTGGGALRDLARVDLAGLDPGLAGAQIVLASDVDNPLLGPQGAAAVYAPQKGASQDEVRLLEAGLRRLAEVLSSATSAGPAVSSAAAQLPGAGAAGGVGFAALAVLGATRRPGVDVVLELTGFFDVLAGADLVITGEGRLDAQTLHGKAPAGVAKAASRAGIDVVVLCGQRDLADDALAAAGICAAYPLTDLEPDLARCLAHPGELLERLASQVATRHLW
jgi:glycerate kinase